MAYSNNDDTSTLCDKFGEKVLDFSCLLGDSYTDDTVRQRDSIRVVIASAVIHRPVRMLVAVINISLPAILEFLFTGGFQAIKICRSLSDPKMPHEEFICRCV